MIASFAKYIKKGTNTLPKNYELANNVGVSKTATVEVGSYLILPAVLADTPYIYIDQSTYNYYSALIANAVYQVENGVWKLTNCEVTFKSSTNTFVSSIMDTPISSFVENFDTLTPSADCELYRNKEYTLFFSTSIRDYDYQKYELKTTLPEGVTLVDDSSDLNNIYMVVIGTKMETKQATADETIW